MLTKREVIAELNTEVERLLDIHYPQSEFPEWVNGKLFWLSYGKRILGCAISEFINSCEDFNDDGSLRVQIHRSLLAFALVSMEFEEPNYNDEITVGDCSFTFSRKAVEFLRNAMGDPPTTKGGWRLAESKIRKAVGLEAMNQKLIKAPK